MGFAWKKGALRSPVLGENQVYVETSKQHVELVGRTKPNGHRSEMEPKEVFQTVKDIYNGNGKFLIKIWNNRSKLTSR